MTESQGGAIALHKSRFSWSARHGHGLDHLLAFSSLIDAVDCQRRRGGELN
jgi:hypothetical protein